MFPVRRELVGKRFAFIQGDGRTGTRKRGHHSGLLQNWNELSWVTGTVLAANVDGIDTQDDSVVSKKVKLFVHYDSRYQLHKEWIKLYSGSHRIFFIEENLVLCRRKDVVGYSSQNYGWPALRMVPILDRNFMDENPHLIPVEYMGSRKELSFIAFEDIIKLFPDEDQTLLFQSIQQNSYLKSDYQSWERIQKTQMILLYGPYSLTGCRVEVNDPSTGRCYRAVIISHDCMKRVLDVMDDQLLKSRKVNPKLIQVNFLASDEDIDKLMCGEAPKAIPTRYSRYGHQVQQSRYQLEDLGSSQPFSHFTLPQWMTNINFMGQNHSNQLPRDDFQKNGVPTSTKLNIVKKQCDEGELDTSSIGSVDVSDHGMPLSDFHNGVQKERKLRMHFSPTHRIVNSEKMKKAPSAFSSKAIDASQHAATKFQGNIGPCLQNSPAVPLSNSNVQHFGSPPSSGHLPVGGLDQHASDRPNSSPFVDTRISRCPPSSPLISPKGQCYDAFPSPPTSLNDLEDNTSNPYLQLSCYQSPQRTRDAEKGPSAGLADLRSSTSIERSFTGLERAASLPKECEMKVSPKLKSSSSTSPDGRQKLQQEQENGSQLCRSAVTGNERYFDGTMHHQPMQHKSTQNQSSNIDQGDLASFLNQLDACFSTAVRKPQQPQHIPDYIKSLTPANATEHLHSMQKNPNFQKDAFAVYMQQRAAGHYPSYQTQDSPTFQETFEQYLIRQISDKQGLVSHDFAVTPTSCMTRSLSSDNFRVAPGQFPMSPPNAPPKKAKGRGRKKARSKDDTSRPSTEASKNVSSLLLSTRKGRAADGTVEGLDKESGSRDNKFDKIRKETQASSKELVSENLDNKNNSLADNEKKVPVKERVDSIANKDMTARVALAFAGFSHGCNLENRSQDIIQNTAEQKIPTGATWIENFKTELPDVEVANAKPELNVICGKKTLGNAHFESIDRPPSPEFLPKRDRGADALELSKSDLLEDNLSNVGDRTGRFVSSVNENLQNSVESCGEKMLIELNNVSEVEQATLKDAVDVFSSSTGAFLGEHEQKNDLEKQESKSEGTVAECIDQSTSIGINCVNKEDEVRPSLPKVPIASLPVVSLGFHAGNLSVASEGQGSNAEKVVRNIYGRALYQRTQTGPNFSQQLRTDKIVGSVSSCELKGAVKPSSEPCFKNHGLKPLSELSNESHELRPLSGSSHENHGLKPLSEHNQESQGFKSLSGPSQDNECATSERICKILASDLPRPTSGLKDILQAEKSRIDVLIKAPAISSAQQSTRHVSPCFLKKEPDPKIIDKKAKIGESRTQKNNCKHKRKPCVCELKITVANLASKAPLSCKLSSTFQSLQRLANENPVCPQLPVISQGPQLPSVSTNSHVDSQPTEGIPLLAEPSFKILERKEIVEEPENPSSQKPNKKQMNALHEETVVSTQADSRALGPNNSDFGSSLWYSKKSEPRSSQKCKHKRRPCRCDVEAAKELIAHVEFLKSSAPNELENSSTETVLSNLEHSISQGSGSPRVITYKSSSRNATVHAYALNDTNKFTSAGEHGSVDGESVDGNQKVSVLNESLPAPEEIPNMLWNPGNNKEQSLQSSSCLMSTSTTGEGFTEAQLKSVASIDKRMNVKISNLMAMNKECQKAIVANEKKIEPVRKCKHKRKPCKCDNASICSTEMKGDETRTVPSGTRKKALSTERLEAKETEDVQRKSLHDNVAKKDDVFNKDLKFVESSELGKKTLIVITSKNQTGVRHVSQRSDITVKKVQEDAMKLKVLRSNAFPSSSINDDLPSDGLKGKERQVKTGGMDPGNLKGYNTPSENIQSNQGQCTSSAYPSASEEGTTNKNRLMCGGELHVSDPLISSGTASFRDSGGVQSCRIDSTTSVVVTGQSSRNSGNDIAVANIEEKKDISSKVVVENLTRNNDESSSLVEINGSNNYANTLQLNSTNLMEKSESGNTEEKDAKYLLLKETACIGEDKIYKGKVETMNECGNGNKCIQVFDDQESVDRKTHSEDVGSNNPSMSEKFKGIRQERQETNVQYDGYSRELRNDADVNEEQSIKSGILMGKEMKTLDEFRQSQEGCVPTSNESPKFPFTAQNRGTTLGERKPVVASNSLKITIPPNLTLPSNILDVPGGRFTARAKIACPQKNLEPLKGGPVNVSFDGGKTYTFASIVEIRNKQNIGVEGQKNVAESKQIPDQGKESKKETEMPASIDAVLLAYSPSDVALKDFTRKEGNTLENAPRLTTNNEGIPEAPRNTENSSVADVVETGDIEEKKDILESLKSENKLIGPPKELRRSSRFSVKNACDSPKEETAEFQNKMKSGCAESTMTYVLPENRSNEKLLADSSSSKTEEGKEKVRKVKPLSMNLESQFSACEKRKKLLQTGKDKMFDCCAIHKNLFCKKCLPFKVKEGNWPVSSRAKEINSAWRTFVRKCAKHDCSRCTECNEISYEAFQTRALDTGDYRQKGKFYLTVRNEEDVAQIHHRNNELGAQKIDDNDHFMSNNSSSIKQLSVDSTNGNKAEKIRVASKADEMDAELEVESEEKKTAFKESLDKKYRKERKSKAVKYQKKLVSKETDVGNDEIGSEETSKGETTVLMVDHIGGGENKTEKEHDGNDRGKIGSSESQNLSWKETLDVMKQEPESDGEQNSRRKLKHDKIKFEKDEKSRKVEGNSTAEKEREILLEKGPEATATAEKEREIPLEKGPKATATAEKEREILLEKGPEATGNQRCQMQLEKQNSCKMPNLPTLHEESATIQKTGEPSSNAGTFPHDISFKTRLPRKRKALEAAENKLLEMKTDERSTDSSDPSGKCLIHGRKTCSACKPFYENEGEWPGWARRGEVHYLWESKSDDRRNFHTVKCRIHLKAKCPRCEPFKDKDGFWPSWLERHAIEEHYSKFRQASVNDTDAAGNLPKENICRLHKKYYCIRCYELKLKTGKWPNDDLFVERADRRRQHEKARYLASWNKCEIHEERICLPCFYFWKKEGRAPYSGDTKVVKRLWKTVASQISSYFCDVHKKRLCKSCTPIFLSEEKFPSRENHLKSIYSWELFKDLLEQYSPKKLTDRKERSVKENNSKRSSSNYFRSSGECIELLEKMIKSNKKSLDKFHCTLHELFPCFACMPKFVKDSCWPNESDYDELWQNWTREHPDEESCAGHGHLFCTECHGIPFLFDKFKKPGVTDVFLDLVAKCSGAVEVSKRKYRKRKLEKSDGDGIELHHCKRDEEISVSSKGRIRSKVMRPGTVDISKLEEVIIEKKAGNLLEIVDGGQAQNERVKGWTKVNKRSKEQPTVAVAAEPVKRKRGRPRKKPLEPEEPAPKKRRGRKPKFGLVEQVRSGSLKIINVDDLRDQLEADHERDPSPSHMEYVQLLDSAEKMNVKYFAISADSDNAIGEVKKNKEKSKIAALENMRIFDDRKIEKDGSRKNVQEENSIEKKQGRKGAASLKESKTPAKLSSMPMWSENDIELILQKVEKAALAAKAKKEEALHRKKQRQGKKPLTVAQVLAIKRKRGGDTRPIMNERAREDLEHMLKEAERRSVDLDTLLEEAIKTKDKEERRKQIAKQKAMEKVEAFLQDKPCDQTPKLPKCRDCRIADKRNADQNAFCRFVMLRRLFKRPKTGKIESAGFCSPASADQSAFIPWSSISSEVDMKASTCHYIVKNIAGQFCAVVEEECLALMLGTRNGAVAWKRAVTGVREMCDACATTVFNIHWVCEKCGFGVCPDCFRSKISENELKGEGYRSFEFNWSACAPGLSHKPTNLTVTQIIPKNALWDLCLQTVDICESLSIPFKLSENVLKKSMPLDRDSSNCHENGKAGVSSERATSEEQDSINEHYGSSEISQDPKLCDHNEKDPCCKSLQPPSISIAPLTYSNAGPVEMEVSNEDVSREAGKPFTLFASNKCTALGNGVEVKLETREDIGDTATNANGRSGEILAGKEETKKIQSPENKVFDLLHSSNSKANVLGTNSLQLNSTGPLFGKLHHCSYTNVESAVSDKSLDGEDLYYRNVCETSLSVLDKIKKWKDASKLMTDEAGENVGIGCEEPWISDEKETEMMAAVNFGNDSLLSDVSMASDDAELVPSIVKADLVNETNNSLTADNATGNTAPQDASNANDGHDSNLIVSPNRHFSPQFQNSLDILAMVASGFGISSNVIAKEEIASCNVSSEKQTSPVVDERKNEKGDSVSDIDGPAFMVDESMFLGDQRPIASYLCDGQLLQLHYSKHPKNIELFRRVWKKGFPLLVSGVTDVLSNQLWKPESFAADFGDELADVVNCLTGDILHQFSVGEFWKGFESIKDRRTDSNGIPMLLKLKDWPPGADFLDKMPKRFDDLMNAIPLPEYTRRDGQLNLVSRLPTNHFIKPDLGPKMYNAYGSAAAPSAGTTNLHLDMSDAVNVMVYVGVPRDPLLGEQEIKDALMTIDIACCEKTKHRVRQPNALPGALWHIYAAEDADKIRMFLRKVAEERKLKYSVHNDPIHDQSFYLDYDMRKRLKAEYGVIGFAICQCLGDAVFIPAGAPHQVLNLHSCVKVAEDFVSPERIGQCFNLTQEFRYLSDRHTNHEDKLQIKNIIYHAVKDSVAVLKKS